MLHDDGTRNITPVGWTCVCVLRTYRHLRKVASCWISREVIESNKRMPKYSVWSLVLVAWVLFALTVAAEGTYDSSYGSTLLVKVQNTSASERRVFVHSGCLVVMLDGNKLREKHGEFYYCYFKAFRISL